MAVKDREIEIGLLGHGVVHGGLEGVVAGGEKNAAVVDIEEVGGREIGINVFHVDWSGHGYMV
jgi:hypothetical protein